MHQGRRAQYRVELDEAAGLKVTVSNPDGSPLAGELVDVSGSGAGVRFGGPEAPNLAVGQIIDLVFTSAQLTHPLTVPATVQHRAEEPDQGSRRYGFRFLQTQNLQTYLPPKLREFFNRRRAMRVTPDTYELVSVTMRVPDVEPAMEVHLENLSELGARITLEPEMEPAFSDTTLVELILGIPGAKETVRVTGDIRYRRLVGQRVQYGIEFNADRTPHFDQVRAVIAKYVWTLFQEMLRSRAA